MTELWKLLSCPILALLETRFKKRPGPYHATRKMSLTPSQAELGNAIVAGSVTFFAVYITLYPFVFSYFREKTEPERTRRGIAYWQFFGVIIIVSILLFITVITATLALWYDSADILQGATLGFVLTLLVGTYNVVKEVASTRKAVQPYAIQNLYQQTYDKEFEKAMQKRFRANMTIEQVTAAMEESRAEAAKKAEKAVAESGLGRKKESDD